MKKDPPLAALAEVLRASRLMSRYVTAESALAQQDRSLRGITLPPYDGISSALAKSSGPARVDRKCVLCNAALRKGTRCPDADGSHVRAQRRAAFAGRELEVAAQPASPVCSRCGGIILAEEEHPRGRRRRW